MNDHAPGRIIMTSENYQDNLQASECHKGFQSLWLWMRDLNHLWMKGLNHLWMQGLNYLWIKDLNHLWMRNLNHLCMRDLNHQSIGSWVINNSRDYHQSVWEPSSTFRKTWPSNRVYYKLSVWVYFHKTQSCQANPLIALLWLWLVSICYN